MNDDVLHSSFRYPNVFTRKSKSKPSAWTRINQAEETNNWRAVCAARDSLSKEELKGRSSWIDEVLGRIANALKSSDSEGAVHAANAISDPKTRKRILGGIAL